MKRTILALAAICCSIAFAGTTVFGNRAMYDSEYSEDNDAFGTEALKGASGVHGGIYIGEGAGASSSDSGDNIVIGRGALRETPNVSGCVAIGHSEMMGEAWNNDTTSINSKQLWISGTHDAFCVNPMKYGHITNTPLYYVNRTLHLNVDNIVLDKGGTLGGGASGSYPTYDLYLSPFGDDRSDGRSALRPKRTIIGCYEAATNNCRVCVFSGDYEIQEPPDGIDDYPAAWTYTNRLTFVAVEGKENTRIVASQTNPKARGLSFIRGYQVFDGFTLVNLTGTDTTKNGSTHAAICCHFRNCDFVFPDDWSETSIDYWNAYFAQVCAFENCRIDGLVINVSNGSYTFDAFINCEFYDSVVNMRAGTIPHYGYRHFSGCVAYNTYFDMGVIGAWGRSHSATHGNFYATDCTFVYDDSESPTKGIVYPEHTTNCYYCISQYAYTNINGNCYGSYTNTLLNSEGVAASIECPAVKSNGDDDYGWKDSGLAVKKVLANRADIRLENGEVAVYQNGVKIGTLTFSPSP